MYLAVLLAPVTFTLFPDERLNLLLLSGGGCVADDADVVGLVTCTDRLVVVRAGIILDNFVETELSQPEMEPPWSGWIPSENIRFPDQSTLW